MSMSVALLSPEWPAPPQVQAAWSTRVGGVSQQPFDSLNLGAHVGDAPLAVQANRQAFAQALKARPVFLQQVHGTTVIPLDQETPDALSADASVTAHQGLACTVMVADCLPILLADKRGRVVAAAHGGWRGLAGGPGAGGADILAATVNAMVKLARCESSDLLAWLGPCIGPEAFEVGADVKAAFEQQHPSVEQFFRPRGQGKWLADLPAFARARFASLGVSQVYGNDGSAQWCTVGNPERYFSHRRDRSSGRIAVSVWLV